MKKTIIAVSLTIASVLSASAFAADTTAPVKQDSKTVAVSKDVKATHKHKHHKKHSVEKKQNKQKLKKLNKNIYPY